MAKRHSKTYRRGRGRTQRRGRGRTQRRGRGMSGGYAQPNNIPN